MPAPPVSSQLLSDESVAAPAVFLKIVVFSDIDLGFTASPVRREDTVAINTFQIGLFILKISFALSFVNPSS